MLSETKLPDFDDMMGLIDNIRHLSYTELTLKNYLKSQEADIVREATTDRKHFVDGKPPSVKYLETTVVFTGFNGELLKLRENLASVSSDLDAAKMRLDLMKSMIDVWRTEQSNKRSAVL